MRSGIGDEHRPITHPAAMTEVRRVMKSWQGMRKLATKKRV